MTPTVEQQKAPNLIERTRTMAIDSVCSHSTPLCALTRLFLISV
jgi:hypothetical protein